MTLTLTAVTYDAEDVAVVAAFWAGLLGRETLPDGDGLLVPGEGAQLGLRFVPGGTRRTGPDRRHLHLTSATADDQRATVERVLRLGGRHVDVGQLPEEGHVVLADPEGSELCVIEPGNAYLEGCGPLGEVTCAGSREVGFFWRDALGWPLVWDRGAQTAVQSPQGGTKVSWDGPPVPTGAGQDRQRLLLSTTDPRGDVQRLVGPGATLVDGGDRRLELLDPDGAAFSLRPA